jgi:hypothetical protein
MPRIPVIILPEAPEKVFALATSDHMFAKLRWEIQGLQRAIDDRSDDPRRVHDSAYHAYNCAVTAWLWGAKISMPLSSLCQLGSCFWKKNREEPMLRWLGWGIAACFRLRASLVVECRATIKHES